MRFQVQVASQRAASRSGNDGLDASKELSRDQLEAEERRRRDDRRAQKCGLHTQVTASLGSNSEQLSTSAQTTLDVGSVPVQVQDTSASNAGRSRGVRRGGRGNNSTDALEKVENAQSSSASAQMKEAEIPGKPAVSQPQPQQQKAKESSAVPAGGGKSGGRQKVDTGSARQSETGAGVIAASSPRPDAGVDAGRPATSQRFYRAGPNSDVKGPAKESSQQVEEDAGGKFESAKAVDEVNVETSKLTPRVNFLLIGFLICELMVIYLIAGANDDAARSWKSLEGTV